MNIHILDIVVWFFGLFVVWFLIDKFSDGDFVEGLGGLIGVVILFIYTIIYIVIFGVCDYNISDIGLSIPNINISW